MVIDGDIEDTDKRQIDINSCMETHRIYHGRMLTVFMNFVFWGRLKGVITATAEKLRKDSLVITVSYPLKSSSSRVLLPFVWMSLGDLLRRIYTKRLRTHANYSFSSPVIGKKQKYHLHSYS